MRKSKLIIGLILSICIVAPILIFIFKFSQNSISSSPSSWSEFATYYTAFLTLGNLLLFAFLSLEIHRYNLQKDNETKRINDIYSRPILSFKLATPARHYAIDNLGKGAALNVVVRSHFENGEWQNARIYYGIKEGDSLILDWTFGANKIAAGYSDVFGREFISFMDNDKLRVIDTSDPQSKKVYQEDFTVWNSPSVNPTWPN